MKNWLVIYFDNVNKVVGNVVYESCTRTEANVMFLNKKKLHEVVLNIIEI